MKAGDRMTIGLVGMVTAILIIYVITLGIASEQHSETRAVAAPTTTSDPAPFPYWMF